MEPVGITNACTSVVVPKSRRIMVTVHSAIKPRGGSPPLTFCKSDSGCVPGSATLSATTAFERSTATIVAANTGILKRPFLPLICNDRLRFLCPRSRGQTLPQIGLPGARLHRVRGGGPSPAEIRGAPSDARDESLGRRDLGAIYCSPAGESAFAVQLLDVGRHCFPADSGASGRRAFDALP